jgi:RNA polymerase sigma-70 factor (ECF subfamily)
MTTGDKGGSDRQRAGDLLLRIVQRDRGAFSELFTMVAPRVKAYLIRLGSDPAAAEDLTQDVLVTVWRKAPQFDPARASAMTWIFVIARNRRIDSLRREDSVVTYGVVPPEAIDEAAPPAELVAGREDDGRMRKAIEALPEDQREVIRRSFFEEEPHSAIAAALRIPLGTVKSRLRIALAKLRSQLEDFQ